MRFQVKTGAPSRQKADCLILPVYSAGPLPPVTRDADRAAGGLISTLVRDGDFRAEAGDTLLLPQVSGMQCRRILLVGLGTRDQYDRKAARKALRAGLAAIGRSPVADVVSYLGTERARGTDAVRRARLAVEMWHETSYRFTAMKSGNGDKKPKQLSLGLGVAARDAVAARRGVAVGEAVGHAMALARDLGNLPPNVCTPSYLAQQAHAIGKRHKQVRVEILNEAEMKRLGMGSLLSVTAGTAEPARLLVLNYHGGGKAAPVVLVGKGITFDSGGISLKPGPQMDEMKYDMSGAGTVLAVVQAAAELRLPVNVVGVVPACENMPGGRATRPSDIVKSMSGQTIEILNTDAEGRLVLCDAMTYARRFKPAAMIDIATLTGACVVALGKHRSGLMSNSDRLAAALLAAGDAADDPAWRLPLGEEYMEQLKSPFADVANIGGKDAGAITAAAFLSRFAGDTAWAHLDIAGTAWVTAPQKGSTGRPVPLLVEYLLNR
jgi:leucyl aminopeptidase